MYALNALLDAARYTQELCERAPPAPAAHVLLKAIEDSQLLSFARDLKYEAGQDYSAELKAALAEAELEMYTDKVAMLEEQLAAAKAKRDAVIAAREVK